MSPPLSLEQSAELYAEMLADVLAASAGFAERLDLESVLAFHPPDAVRELLYRAPPSFRLQEQSGGDLAERMAHASLEAGAAGVDRVLIRGSDNPTLSFELCQEALDRLDAGDDVVLTPDQGGGYSMIGLRAPQPALFEIEMSTSAVLDETLSRARALGLRASKTEPCFDLDTVGDIALFREWLCDRSDVEFADRCPRTVQLLRDLSETGVL
jgi:glycosyltransferase A (GT-A) superfamily protein (DUF2064 family)